LFSDYIKNCFNKRIFFFFTQILLFSEISFSQTKYVFEEAKMGSPFAISIYASDSMKAATAAQAAFRKADELNEILSDYIDSSELNKLSLTSGHDRYIEVSQPLFDILQKSMEAAKMSNGAYDITIGPVVKLWRIARKTKMFPEKDAVKSALAKTGYQYLHLDSVHHSVWLEKPGMKLDVGGLGKGFVAAAAFEVLKQYGFNCAMINAGGKIVIGEPPPNKDGWLIGINAPQEKENILPELLVLKNISIATSGDIYQFVELNGKRYSHIVDPKTGIGLTRRKNVTAIANDGTTADWLATACSVFSEKESFRLIEKFPGAALLITENRKGRIYKRSSPNFKNYLQKHF